MRRIATPTRPDDRAVRLSWLVHRAAAVIGVAAVLAALLPAVASEAAQPKTVAEAQARVDQLNEQAEVVTEQYNAAQARLAQSQRTAAAAAATTAKAREQLAGARAKVSAFAAQSYESGGTTDTLAALLTVGDPGQALAKMSALQQIGQVQSATLTRVRAADQQYRQASAAASQAAANAKALSTQVAKQKQQIDALLAQGQRVLAKLTAEQRAQLLAAQRAKAAAEQARAAAALAAVRAQAAARAQAAPRVSRDIARPADPAPAAAPQTASGSSVAARAVAAAMTKLGRPYVWGAAGPNSFDCSGLVQWAYRQAGVSTAHYTGAFWNAYRHVSQSELRPGDLVFFYPDYHHVGIYIGGGMMIDAPQTGDVVKIQSVASHRSYRGAVRVVG